MLSLLLPQSISEIELHCLSIDSRLRYNLSNPVTTIPETSLFPIWEQSGDVSPSVLAVPAVVKPRLFPT